MPYHVDLAFEELQEDAYRGLILKQGYRSGGRGTDQLRDLSSLSGRAAARSRLGAVSRAARRRRWVTATRGTTADDRGIARRPHRRSRKRFILHYNFPPFSVGEPADRAARSRAKSVTARSPSVRFCPWCRRRMYFPYTLRVVSEIMASNGSILDGFDLRRLPLADGRRRADHRACGGHLRGPASRGGKGDESRGILTDILGEEDHFGDMDFKVAGTTQGHHRVPARPQDSRVLSRRVAHALRQARDGRMYILTTCSRRSRRPARTSRKFAPRIHTIQSIAARSATSSDPAAR